MTIAPTLRPYVLCEVEVARVERLSPSFVRVELAAPELADLGVDGPTWDQRVKLVVPATPGGPLPRMGDGEDWYAAWQALPAAERGHLRTYTLRDLVGSGADTRAVIDLVVHGEDGHGEAGPGSRWAAGARVGTRAVLLGPRRGVAWGGIEFAAPYGAELVLAGDETAVPAVLAILAQLDPGARGAAYLEVPTAADVQTAVHPAGVRLVWLPREGAALGERLRTAVLDGLGVAVPGEVVRDEDVDPDLWETPTWSSSGEDLDAPAGAGGSDLDGVDAGIAGESRVVTGLRRTLVRDLGMDRRQVAFMGYWREGVSRGA